MAAVTPWDNKQAKGGPTEKVREFNLSGPNDFLVLIFNRITRIQ